MERTPTIVAVGPMRSITFSQWVSLNRCKLKAALRSAIIAGNLPEPLPTRPSLVGLFHHRAMELAVQSASPATLRDSLEAEIADLQLIVSSSPRLRRLGSVSGWDEVNRSVVLAQERVTANRGLANGAAAAAETSLQSASGLLEGRPDFFSANGSVGLLREYKSGRIRDEKGELLADYRSQALFYSSLIFDNSGVELISAIVESLSGDRCEISINREEARQFGAEVEAMLESFNRSLAGLANIETLAEPTQEGCSSCIGRIACLPFKRVQDSLELSGEQFVVQGYVRGLETRRAQHVALVQDVCRDKEAELTIPESIASQLEQRESYCFGNLSRHGAGWLWGHSSRVFAGG
jgi:PD-(D/E)XK nuclease superfamily